MLSPVLGTAFFQLVGMGMTLLVGVQLARYLGPAQYGVYGTLIGIISVAAVLAQAALPQLLIRDLAPLDAHSEHGQIALVFKQAARVFVVSSVATLVIVALVMFGASGDGPESSRESWSWVFLLVIAFALLNFVSGALRGLHRVAMAQMVAAALRPAVFAAALLIAGLVGISMSASNALLIQFVSLVIVITTGVLLIKSHLPTMPRQQPTRFDAPSNWFSDGVPMMATELVRTLDAQVAILILAVLVTDADVGQYRVAISSAVIFAFPYTIATLILMPAFAKDYAEGNLEALEKRAQAGAWWSTGSTLLCLLLMLAFGENLVELAFGADYRASVPVLIVLGLAFLVQAILGQGAAVLNMCRRPTLVTKAYALGLVFTVATGIPLVQLFGYLGMGWAVLIGMATRSLFLWLCVRHAFRKNVALGMAFRRVWVGVN